MNPLFLASSLYSLVWQVDTNNNCQLEFGEFCEFLKQAKQGFGLNQAVEQVYLDCNAMPSCA